MTQTLVTGGSGFIGQHLVALLARDRRVRILDLRPPAFAPTGAQYVKGSVLDPVLVREALDDVEEVYHLAALPGMWTAHKADFHAVNCLGTEVVIDAARKRGVPRFVHCSTESILFNPSSTEVSHYGADLWRARRNARGLYTFEDAGRTKRFASRCVRIPGGDCQSHNANRTPPWKSHAADFDAAAFSWPTYSNLP